MIENPTPGAVISALRNCTHFSNDYSAKPARQRVPAATAAKMPSKRRRIGKQNGVIETLRAGGASWYRGTDAAAALGYTNTRQAVRTHVHEEDRRPRKDLQMSSSSEPLYHEGGAIFISARGLKRLVCKCQKPSALKLAKDFGIEVDTNFVRKEPEIVKHLRDFLGELHIATELQKSAGRYHIDMYLPDYKLAFEVDEHGHCDRDQQDERQREESIRRTLGCDFMRINPDAPDFNMFKLCARLASRIM